jgi:hypothetical protein
MISFFYGMLRSVFSIVSPHIIAWEGERLYITFSDAKCFLWDSTCHLTSRSTLLHLPCSFYPPSALSCVLNPICNRFPNIVLCVIWQAEMHASPRKLSVEANARLFASWCVVRGVSFVLWHTRKLNMFLFPVGLPVHLFYIQSALHFRLLTCRIHLDMNVYAGSIPRGTSNERVLPASRSLGSLQRVRILPSQPGRSIPVMDTTT